VDLGVLAEVNPFLRAAVAYLIRRCCGYCRIRQGSCLKPKLGHLLLGFQPFELIAVLAAPAGVGANSRTFVATIKISDAWLQAGKRVMRDPVGNC
jgi:hypothetical protein